MDASAFLAGAGDRQTRTVHLSPDPDALTAAQVAAKAATGGSLEDAAPALAEARRAALESSYRFVVGTIPATVWTWLREQNRPTDDQLAEAKRLGIRLRFDADRFPPVAVAACLRSATNPAGDTVEFATPTWNADREVVVDPAASDLARQVWDTFSMVEATLLWGAAVELNDTGGPSAQIAAFANGSTTTRSGVR